MHGYGYYGATSRQTVKPTAKPAVKPTAKPAVKPTVKPAVKPTVKPSVLPSTAPTVKQELRMPAAQQDDTMKASLPMIGGIAALLVVLYGLFA